MLIVVLKYRQIKLKNDIIIDYHYGLLIFIEWWQKLKTNNSIAVTNNNMFATLIVFFVSNIP